MLSFFSKKWKQTQNWLKKLVSQDRKPALYKKGLEQPLCKILCIDDDKSFCLFLQQLAYSLSIQLDTVYSIQEAKKAIEKDTEYKAFIIDGHLPDGSGFELVAWIREKKEITLPIVFISRIYQDAASFRILKESLKVNYVLEKPIRSAEVHQLLIQICHLVACSKAIMSEPSFSEELLTDLKISYQKTIVDKIERLEKMILDVQRNPRVENLQILRDEVHRIAGSAGSYGYMAVSDLCKSLEIDLMKQVDLAKLGQFNLQWLASLDDFFTQIKLHFQIPISANGIQSLSEVGLLPTLYIVDEDQAFLTQFTQSNQNLNFEILIESHPDHAIQTLLEVDFYPQILLLNAHYVSSTLTGYELIQAFYQNNDELTTLIAFMVEGRSLEDQVQALQRGLSAIIAKPFLPSLVLPFLDQIPFRPLPLYYKVLVIDDDWDICQYIVKTLKYAGLEIKALHDVAELEDFIKSYQPDLILLDIHLHDEAGVGILQRLRNDWDYENMLIGMLSLTQQDTHLLQQCYEANVDEILFKPLDGGILQRKIAILFKRQANETLSAKNDSKIKLESIQVLKRYLNALQYQHLISLPKALVVFEVKESVSISPKVQKEMISFILEALEELLNRYEMATNLGEGHFALVFQGYDPNFIQLFMHHFLSHLYSHLQNHIVKIPFHINEALVLLSEGQNASELLQRSDELLLLAQKQGKPICLMTDPIFTASKEVFIFHEDMPRLDSLQTLFQEQGFVVSSFSSFDEFSYPRLSWPLFILTASSAESKRVHLLKKLFMRSQIQIPILHLPYLPEKDYCQRLLSELNYFEKPFSLLIFLTKGSESE